MAKPSPEVGMEVVFVEDNRVLLESMVGTDELDVLERWKKEVGRAMRRTPRREMTVEICSMRVKGSRIRM